MKECNKKTNIRNGPRSGEQNLSSLATIGALLAIVIATRGLRFDAWNKCQELFTEEKFMAGRKRIFLHLSDTTLNWTKEDLEAAIQVAGNMDKLCRLAGFLGARKLIKVWGNPIGKAWAILQVMVGQERDYTKWLDKWIAFEEIGRRSLDKFPAKEKTKCIAAGVEFGEFSRAHFIAAKSHLG
jgi:hypothetical protein